MYSAAKTPCIPVGLRTGFCCVSACPGCIFAHYDPENASGKGCVRYCQPQGQTARREVLRVKHYSLRTEGAYVLWVRRFLKFHRDRPGGWKHPRALGATEVGAFLNHLANVEHVAAATQNQALNALVFLYGSVLQIELDEFYMHLRFPQCPPKAVLGSGSTSASIRISNFPATSIARFTHWNASLRSPSWH